MIYSEEFEGLAGFEEIKSLKVIKEVEHSGMRSLVYEHFKGGQLCKSSKGKKRKKSKQCSYSPSLENNATDVDQKVVTSVKGNWSMGGKEKLKIDESDWRAIFTPEEVIEALKEIGFKKPTEIQKLTIPAAINKQRDIIGAAETGSGKTLAFAIPVIDGILKIQKKESEIVLQDDNCSASVDDGNYSTSDDENGSIEDIDNGFRNIDETTDLSLGCVNVINNIDFDFLSSESKIYKSKLKNKLLALFITPTRELAVQIKKHVDAILTKTAIKTAVIIGGLSHEKQERMLNKFPEIVIGTPGRLWDMIQQGNEHLAKIAGIRYLVIDETDRLLEKGHFNELQELLAIINEDSESMKRRQTFIFSATLTMAVAPPKRLNFKKKKVKDITSEMKIVNLIKLIGIKEKPKIVDITRKSGIASALSEAKINCDKDEKDLYLYYFIKKFPGRTLIFCNSINCVKRLSKLLNILQCKPQTLHASKLQKQRLKSLEHFSSEGQSVLLATDVAARGIDISGINHILHYELPRTAEIYIHRSGRTARANQEGISVLLIDYQEMDKYRQLCTNLNRSTEIPSLPLDGVMLKQVKERVHLAQSIEKAEYGLKKKQTDNSWFEKMAAEADLIWNDDNYSDDDLAEDNHLRKKTCNELASKKLQLNQLLSRPTTKAIFSVRYPSASGIFATQSNSMIGPDKVCSAIELLKQRKNVNVKIGRNNIKRLRKKT